MERYIYSLILLLSSGLLLFANVKVIDTAGCNLAIVGETAQNTYSLESISRVHNWWSGVFNGLDTKNPTTFILDMTNTGTRVSPGDVSNWDGLYPFYSYGRYWDYNNFIYYIKNDDGYWVSSDVFAKNRLAGNGKTPIQNVIPAALADEFLSENENYWSSWQEIKDTKINVGSNTFTMTKQFNSQNAAISFRVPYTYDYQFQYMRKLTVANIPGVTVYDIGNSSSTTNKQRLYVVEISDQNAAETELKDRPVVLMYANEDGNEPDSCWVINGAMNYLIQGIQNNDIEVKKILSEVTFLFVPMLDPMGWRDSSYGEMAYSFYVSDYRSYWRIREEAVSYATFINDWCGDKGRRLDIVTSLHNIECAEGPNVMFPIVDTWYDGDYVEQLREMLLGGFGEYKTSKTVWMYGLMFRRFNGWCMDKWGSIPLLSEVNSRYPVNRLNMLDMDKLGEMYVKGYYNYLLSDDYDKAMVYITRKYSLQTERRNQFLESDPDRTIEDVLNKGF